MLSTRITFTLCAGLLAVTGCSKEQTRTMPRAEQEVTHTTSSVDPAMVSQAGPRTGNDRTSSSAGSDSSSNSSGTNAGSGNESQAAAGNGTNAQPGACELAVYFDTNSARLDASSQQRLDTVAECMKRRQVDHATIVGQTDPSGTPQHNQELGMQRAKAVADYLRGRGVPEDQIRVRSKGEVASAQSQELWPVERRAGVSVN